MRKQEIKNMAFELKALKARQFEGYGSVFGNVDYGGDVVIHGAFARTLQDHKDRGVMPQMFWMHQMDKVPGKWIEMEEDDKGLYVKGEFVDTPLGNEIHTLVQQKAVRGLSIGFVTTERDYDKEGNRLIKEVDLWEVSPVSLAMNPLAAVTAAKSRLSRDFEYVPETRDFKRQLEEHLCDIGCSKRIAMRLISNMFKGLDSETLFDDDPQGDPVDDVDEDEAGMQEVLKSLGRTADKMLAASLK
jgi:HK97 family phage prohead protease